MIYIVQIIITLLIIGFIIFFILEIYYRIFKKESKAFLGIVISLSLLLLIERVRNHLIKSDIVETIKTSEIEQSNSSFSKKELSNINIVSEKRRTDETKIYVVFMPQKDTIYMKRDFHNENKFWVHYKKYEILGITVPIGYIMKN